MAQAQALLDAEDPNVPITQDVEQERRVERAVRARGVGRGARRRAERRRAAHGAARAQAQARANDRQAQLEKERSERLVATGAVSQADYDLRSNSAAATAAAAQAIEQSLAAAKDRVMQQEATIASVQSHLAEVTANAPRQVATRQATVVVRQAALDVAKAQLAQAERNLGYAKIVAPITGIVARKAMTVGDHVAPGQLVVAIAQTDGLYVTANYREGQLEHMRQGQPATVHVDALGIDLHGTVQSLGGATGSRLSVLPPENASGNYVKVVQRIPVRIALDAGQPGLDLLRIGMSVEPKVTVR